MGQHLYIVSGRSKNDVQKNMDINLSHNQQEEHIFIILPGADFNLNIDASLMGEGADISLSGIYLCSGNEKVNIKIQLSHEVRHCTSRQMFKGILCGHSAVNFDGKILVVKDAQQTAAYQENHSIVLSEHAKVDTKPQLEIYADDVKCTHGATVGRLDDEELFYMQSRGITQEDAKILQIISFLAPVLERIEEENREEITDIVENSIKTIIKSL